MKKSKETTLEIKVTTLKMTKGIKVTEAIKKDFCENVAKIINDTKRPDMNI